MVSGSLVLRHGAAAFRVGAQMRPPRQVLVGGDSLVRWRGETARARVGLFLSGVRHRPPRALSVPLSSSCASLGFSSSIGVAQKNGKEPPFVCASVCPPAPTPGGPPKGGPTPRSQRTAPSP